jgi:hypothetical protein
VSDRVPRIVGSVLEENRRCWNLLSVGKDGLEHYCEAQPARPYLTGWRCKDHTPARMSGREDIEPPKRDWVPKGQPVSDYWAVYNQRRAARIAAKRQAVADRRK